MTAVLAVALVASLCYCGWLHRQISDVRRDVLGLQVDNRDMHATLCAFMQGVNIELERTVSKTASQVVSAQASAKRAAEVVEQIYSIQAERERRAGR